ncbi:GTP-binding protein [Alkalibaculum bacchi]|uniref:GTPase Obg n=1 Tax=Alkalibaculum bacchi TaxID=645887 RepID=A0A366IF27_9FIRM|nr:GTPase ObgE [Alkalibaculum bacchi]RBP69042.1 GTP-binding protein [Alkalibaculum bacchi]
MFVDRVQIDIKAGNGGHGSMAFRREKYVPNGGPAGGDGGKGGDVVFKVDSNLRTLVDFRYKRKHEAPSGGNGEGSNRSGKAGENLIIGVPPGTVIFNKDTGNIIADLTEMDEEVIIAKGGKGGRGNQHFATATRQAPHFAEGGEKGQELTVVLELKLLADVGLLGFPNVGKSTFLSVVSKAKPKIANYHFTTLVPNLGVVKWKDYPSFVVADIPGIIEGANEGAGLGHQFLRHVERTKLLIHILDVSGFEGRDPYDDFKKINLELEKHNKKLSERRQIVALNKADVVEDLSTLDELKEKLIQDGFEVFVLSAATNQGIEAILDRTATLLKEIGEVEPIFEVNEEEAQKVYRPTFEKDYRVRRENDYYVIEGELVERLLTSVNFDDYDSVAYFQKVLRDKGVIRDLEDLGIEDGKIVRMGDIEFEYFK